jgi:hypothetical protein
MALETRYDGILQADLATARTTDGFKISDLWAEAEAFRAAYNQRTSTMLAFMGYVVTKPDADIVRQATSQWQRATEFGKPDTRLKINLDMEVTTGLERFAAGLEWTDFSELLGLTGDVLTSAVGSIFTEDQRLTYRQMWEQFFDNAGRSVVDVFRNKSVTQLPFYNGDSRTPPNVGDKTFSGTHNHYLLSATTNAIVVADLDTLLDTVEEHGFNRQLYLFGSRATVKKILAIGEPEIQQFYVQADELLGTDAVNLNQAGAFTPTAKPINSMFTVVGLYDSRARIAIAKNVPDGYIGAFSHEGPLSPNNPLQLRLPQNPDARGVKVNVDSHVPFAGRYYSRFQGIGTRQYGNGAAMQYIHSGSYVVPSFTWSTF